MPTIVPRQLPVLSVVTVNYNLSEEMLDSLTGLREHVREVPYEIIVVDNDSKDAARDRLFAQLRAWDDVQLVALGNNIGFGRACNLGARRARGAFLLFLNPDTRICGDFVAPLLRHCQEDVTLAAVGPRTNRSRWFDFSAGFQPNLWLELLNVLLVGRWVEAAAVALLTARRGARPMPVGWVLGAALLTRREVFDRLGGFDEDFFLYYEEVDYCRRVLAAGHRVGYCPDVTIEHAGAVTGKRDYEAFTRRFYVGKALFMSKAFSGGKRRFMTWLVRLQIAAQWLVSALWYPRDRAKYGGKMRGGRQALRDIGLRCGGRRAAINGAAIR